MNFSVAKKGQKSVFKRGLKMALKGSHEKVASCIVAVSEGLSSSDSGIWGGEPC